MSRYSLFDRKQLLLAPIAGRQSDVRAERVTQLKVANECLAITEHQRGQVSLLTMSRWMVGSLHETF